MHASSFDPNEEFRLATFTVGDDLFAMDIMRIKEIVRPLPTTAVPKAPPGMVGVVDLRGTVLPLFDLRLRFGLGPRREDDLPLVRHLIITIDGRLLGIVVDQVMDVVNVKRGELRVGDGMLAGEAAEVFLGVCPVPQEKGPDRLALLLNLRRVLLGAHALDVGALLSGTNRTILPTQLGPSGVGAGSVGAALAAARGVTGGGRGGNT
jgi:purine-binding chemotaxis protein CheW